MAITDELRHNIEGAEQLYGRECPRLRAIADRIDEEHKKAMDDSYRDGYQEGKRDGDDEWYEEHESYLEEHGWYQALDADKKPVCIGAAMDSDHYEDGTVVGLQFFNTANKNLRVLIAIRPHGWDTPTWRDPESYRHHKQPTVEDVLREMLDKWGEMPSNMTNEAIVAEYAAKLQLRGDE